MFVLRPVLVSGWKPQIESWTEKFEAKYPHLAKSLGKWATDICTVAIPFIREECAEAPGIPSMDANLVQATRAVCPFPLPLPIEAHLPSDPCADVHARTAEAGRAPPGPL